MAESNQTSGRVGRLTKFWREWRGFVYFVVAMILFRSVIADWNQVPSGSMEPNIMVGDRIVVDKISYDLRVPFTLTRIHQWSDPQRGDVITFPNPRDDEVYVKRLIAVPGDVVEMRNNRLIINGERATYRQVEGDLADRLSSQLHQRSLRTHRLLEESLLGSTRIIMESRRRGNPMTRSFGPVEVPADSFFVMGDNRDNSKDSREFGFLERDRVLGRAYAIAFSVDTSKYYMPRPSRFFTDLE